MKKKLLISLLSIAAILIFWQPSFAQNLLTNVDSNTQANAPSVNNRELNWVKPQNGDTVYVGDTLTMQWTSQNVDSILIGGYIAQGGPDGGGYFMLTSTDIDHYDSSNWKPVAASKGVFKLYLDPKNMGGSITIDSMFLYDAADTSFKDVVYPVYVQDTFPMMIRNTVPYFGMTDFPATSNISCNFTSDSIVPGTGQLHLKKADGTTVEDVNVADLQFWGDGFSFMPNPALVPGESYYIEIDAGLVKSADGTKTFGGLTGKDWSFTVASSTLYFSEYIEGSSNNKALEIFNPTGNDINLDDYAIAGSFNGKGINWDTDMYHFPKGTVLKAGAVFVLANSQADSAILSVADQTLAYNAGGYVVGFNGDDARVLIRIVNNGDDWIWVDQIGNPWEAPGSGWDVAGTAAATKDHTLLRKASVKMGTTDWGSSAGSDASSSQWIVKPKDYSDNLGSPTPVSESNRIAVTFNVNMSGAANFDPTRDSVFIAGMVANPAWQEPGTNHALRMSDADSNMVYSIKIDFDTASNIEYKYFINAGWDGGEWQGGDNRKVHIVNDTTLNDIFGNINNTLIVNLPFLENFETATASAPISLSGWTNANVATGGMTMWMGKTYKSNTYAQISSYKSTSTGADSVWLITPGINMDNTTDEKLSFDVNVGYWTHNGLSVMISTDYDQKPEDIGMATWKDVTSAFTIPSVPTDTYGSFASAGSLDVSGYNGTMYVAFVYNGDASKGETTTYQIDSVMVQSTTGINNIDLSNHVGLYPNPGNGIFNIALNGTLKGEVSVRIVDITGRLVFQKTYNNVSDRIPINISNETSSMYFITLSDAKQTIVKKFMKQ